MDTQTPNDTDAPTTSRRNLIASLLAGGALAATPLFVSQRASAEGSTTTTSPNRSNADNAALNSLLGLERTAVRAYTAAAGSTALSEDDKVVMAELLARHRAYVDAIKGYLGTAAVADTSSPAATTNASLASQAPALIAIEERAITAHTAALASLEGLGAATLVASIISAEARNAAVLAILSGKGFAAATAQ